MPIRRLEEHMVAHGIITPARAAEIAAAVAAEMDAAEKFAEESPEPDPAHVMDNVFAPGPSAGGR